MVAGLLGSIFLTLFVMLYGLLFVSDRLDKIYNLLKDINNNYSLPEVSCLEQEKEDEQIN